MSSPKSFSKISVGLIVYNESKYIQQTINEILSQTYPCFEVVIGDNCSTDGTSELIQEIAATEPRIRHLRHDQNIGALQNWNRVIQESEGNYFVLASGHDRWSSNYLADLGQVLDANENASLAFGRTVWIGEDGEELSKVSGFVDTSGMGSLQRFGAVMLSNQNYLYGMMRMSSVKKVGPQKEIIGSGEIFLQGLASVGVFVLSPSAVWYRRENRSPESGFERLIRYHGSLFSSDKTRRHFRVLPYLRMFFTYSLTPFNFRWPFRRRLITFFVFFPYLVFRFTRLVKSDFLWTVRAFWLYRQGRL